MLQEDFFDGELNVDKAAEQTPTSASSGKYARAKTKKLTLEQLAARRRRLWVMIMKKEIPRVSKSCNNKRLLRVVDEIVWCPNSHVKGEAS